jgi:hypothetical protein
MDKAGLQWSWQCQEREDLLVAFYMPLRSVLDTRCLEPAPSTLTRREEACRQQWCLDWAQITHVR